MLLEQKNYFAVFVLTLQLYITNGDPTSPSSGTIKEFSPARNQLLTWASNLTNLDKPQPPVATTEEGIPVPSLTASQAIGIQGQVLLQDFKLLGRLAAFNRERIPERVVHAKGAGAYGYFVVTHDISQYTKAKFLNGIGKKTPVFVRFSTVGGSLGSSDTAVDPHGFAIKFYTEDGNHDLVGNQLEVFPIRDPMLFSDLNRSRKRNPRTNLNDRNMWWDFTSHRPETTLHLLHLFSDIGRADGYRRMNGSSVHAFKFVNKKNDVVFAKFEWISQQPSPSLTYQEAAKMNGINPDYFTEDLYDAIETGNFPQWTVNIQVMTPEQVKTYPFNPFDITRSWREEDIPYIPVGKLVLDRNPENFFAEVEQVAFAPSNMVPGIEPSPDRMLAGRLFAYSDTQRYRLGVNHQQLPINMPLSKVTSYKRDGQSCHGDNGGGRPNYHPNSFGGAVPDKSVRQVAFQVEGTVDRYDIPEDEFVGARLFLERDVGGGDERKRLVESIGNWLKDADSQIRERVLKNNFYPISEDFGNEVRLAVKQQLGNSF